MEDKIFTIFVALVVLANPITSLPLFIDITKNATTKQVNKASFIVALSVLIEIIVFTFIGTSLLKMLGISIGAFKLAGGILIFLIAVKRMNGEGNPTKPDYTKQSDLHTEIFNGTALLVAPLSIPMIMGPGAISTVIIYSTNASNRIPLVIVGLIISLIIYVTFFMSKKFSKYLGETGLNVLSRVLGLLLAAVAAQIFLSGLFMVFPALKHA